jgi:hypothetical protein
MGFSCIGHFHIISRSTQVAVDDCHRIMHLAEAILTSQVHHCSRLVSARYAFLFGVNVVHPHLRSLLKALGMRYGLLCML